jgi:O-antigen ligase
MFDPISRPGARELPPAKKRRLFLIFVLKDCAIVLPLLVFLPTRSVQFAVIVVAFLAGLMVFIEFRPRNKWLLSLSIVILLAVFSGTGWLATRIPSVREKVATIFDPHDSHFETRSAQISAHTVQWRLVFWRRCIEETWHRAPMFGLGFGTNLTDLMRDTPDWPMFEDSQNAAKYGSPNRHPHSAHVTVFARLGLVGLLLWFGVLGTVFVQGLRNLRRARELYMAGREPTPRLRLLALFGADTTILAVWLVYVIAMSFGVVLENPFGGIWFWTLTGVIANRRKFSRGDAEARS